LVTGRRRDGKLKEADIRLLHQALHVLRSRCDGAAANDGQGFAQPDVVLGRHLAELDLEAWEPWMQGAAWEMARRYPGQLLAAGIDISSIARPEAELVAWEQARREGAHHAHCLHDAERDALPDLPPAAPRSEPWRLVRHGDRLVLSGPYNDDLLEGVREIPTRRFDRSGDVGPANSNVFDLSQRVADPLLTLVDQFGVLCTEAAFYTLYELSQREPEAAPTVLKTLSVVRDRFVIDHPYDAQLVNAMRAIAGRRFDAEGRYGAPNTNHFPCSYESVAPLRALAAQYDLDISPEAAHLMDTLEDEHADLEQQQASRQVMSRATDARLDIATLGGTLRPFQAAGVAYALETKRTFIADEMGLGKTIEALATLEAAQAYPALVVCPASVKFNWEREIRQWLPHRSVAVLSGRTPQATADLNVINYDILGRLLPKDKGQGEQLAIPRFEAVVLDESHYIKNGKARRTQHAQTLGRGVPMRLCLTGTPIDNRPIELVSQLDFLDRLQDFGGFWPFVERYCDPQCHRYGWDFSGADHLGELHERLRGLGYIRRLKQEVLPELPPKQRVYIPVEITNRREYNRVEKDTIAWLGERAARQQNFVASIAHLPKRERRRRMAERAQDAQERAARAETLVCIEALKQVCAQGKMAAVQDWIETFLESGEKLVGFAWHQEIVDALAKAWQAPRITGKTGAKRRQEIVDAFQTDPDAQLVFLNMRAGGAGLTLSAASNALFVELGWTPTAHDQAEDRCHRIGQAGSVTAWYLIARGTIDEDIYDLLEDKRAVVDAVTEGGEAARRHQILSEVTQRLLAKA
jgi:SNF2-related domain